MCFFLYIVKVFLVFLLPIHVFICLLIKKVQWGIWLLLPFRGKQINVLSLNVNCICESKKRKCIVDHYLYPVNNDKKPSIVCFQDTRTRQELEESILLDFQYDTCFAHSPIPTAGGLIVAFNLKLNYSVYSHEAIILPNSEVLIVHCEIEGLEYVIVNAYIRPKTRNDELLELLEQAMEFLDNIDCKRVLWCGDFNVTFSELDFSRKDRTGDNNQAVLEYWLELSQYADVFRMFHPFDRKYTFVKPDCASRLDYFLSSVDLTNQVIDVKIDCAFATDHAPVYIRLSL